MSQAKAKDLDIDVIETGFARDARYGGKEEFATSTVIGSRSPGAALQGTHS